MSLARDIAERIFFPNRDPHAIPVLDGGFSPNQRLEQAAALVDLDAPDAIAFSPRGDLFVSSLSTVFRCTGQAFTERTTFAEVATGAGALACSADGRLLVAAGERGVLAFDHDGVLVGTLAKVDGQPFRCPTAIAVAGDGQIFIADGSRHNGPDRWLQDLMETRAPSGRLIACSADLTSARVVQEGLEWPAGVAVSHAEDRVLVTEAWPHRLVSFDRKGGDRRVLIGNSAGYPGRIARGCRGDYWIAFFALRSQLTEFVLREPAFRKRMMQQVPPNLWIGPSLGGSAFDYREPMQIGRIKKLGIQKPWAPARSYGLVARIDETGRAIESLHSRVSGHLHGITDVREQDGGVLVVSKGHGKLARAGLTRPN